MFSVVSLTASTSSTSIKLISSTYVSTDALLRNRLEILSSIDMRMSRLFLFGLASNVDGRIRFLDAG